MSKIMFLDLEVQNNPYFGSVASPHHKDNYVVAVGWAVDSAPYDGEAQHKYYDSPEAAENWLHIPDDVWLVVCHNAAFEIGWMWARQRDVLTKFINRGGRFFCTQLGHYRLSRQQERYPALGEIATQYGGTTKVDAVKLLWEQGTLTSEIDRDLLIEYLAGSSGDIENTRKVFWGEYQELVERDMWDTVLTQCDGLLFNAVCMTNGVYVNRTVAWNNLERMNTRLAELQGVLDGILDELPEDIKAGAKFSSLYHRSALIYGGTIKVDGRVPSTHADGSPKYVKADHVLCLDTNKLIRLENGADPEGLGLGNLDRYKRGKNTGRVKIYREDTEEQATKLGSITYNCKGVVDLSTYSKVFTDVFIEEFSTQLKLHDESPVISTSGEALTALLSQPQTTDEAKRVLGAMAEHDALNKIIGTFYYREDTYANGNPKPPKGALQYLTDESLIHHSLSAVSTVTGRLSSSSPNYQNLPTSKEAGVHEYIQSRFGEDGCIIEADYSNLEVVVLADLTKDKNLMDLVRSGKSTHTMNAAAIKGITYEEYDAILKDETHELHDEYSKFREDCKPKEFSANYGASARGVAYAAGCSVEEGQEFLDTKAKTYPDVEEFVRRVQTEVEENAISLRENVDGTWRLYNTSYWKAPSGIEYAFRTSPKTIYKGGKPYTTQEFSPTQMRNYPVQGEASLFVQVATGFFIRELMKYPSLLDKVIPINTVHDSVWLDVHNSVRQEAKELLTQCLSYVPELMKNLGYNLDLPYKVEATYGVNLQDQHNF